MGVCVRGGASVGVYVDQSLRVKFTEAVSGSRLTRRSPADPDDHG